MNAAKITVTAEQGARLVRCIAVVDQCNAEINAAREEFNRLEAALWDEFDRTGDDSDLNSATDALKLDLGDKVAAAVAKRAAAEAELVA